MLANSRLDFDQSCRVCGSTASGIHYGVQTCEGCKGFFKRSAQKHQEYRCYNSGGHCDISGPESRSRCKLCRYRRCIAAGMSLTATKVGRMSRQEKMARKALMPRHQNPIPIAPAPARRSDPCIPSASSASACDAPTVHAKHSGQIGLTSTSKEPQSGHSHSGSEGTENTTSTDSGTDGIPTNELPFPVHIRAFASVTSETVVVRGTISSSSFDSSSQQIISDCKPSKEMTAKESANDKPVTHVAFSGADRVSESVSHAIAVPRLDQQPGGHLAQNKDVFFEGLISTLNEAGHTEYREDTERRVEFMVKLWKEGRLGPESTCNSNLTIASYSDAIKLAIDRDLASTVRYSLQIPGFSKLDPDDARVLLRDSAFSMWMLQNFPYFVNGESYALFYTSNSGEPIHYSRYWMSQFVPEALICDIMDLADEMNLLEYTFLELSVLRAIAIVCPGRKGLKNRHMVMELHNDLMEALYRAFSTRPHQIPNILLEKTRGIVQKLNRVGSSTDELMNHLDLSQISEGQNAAPP